MTGFWQSVVVLPGTYQSPWLASSIYTHFLHTGINTTHTAVARATWLKAWRVAFVFFVCLFFLKLRKISDVYFLVSRCPRWEKFVQNIWLRRLWKWFSCDSSETTPLQFDDTHGSGLRLTRTHAHTHTHTYTHKHKALKTLTKIQHKLLFLAYINMLFLMLWIYYTMFFFFFFYKHYLEKKTNFKNKFSLDFFFWLHKLNMLFFQCCKYITYAILLYFFKFHRNTFLCPTYGHRSLWCESFSHLKEAEFRFILAEASSKWSLILIGPV